MSVEAMAWVFNHSDTTGADRLVLLALADHADADGTCWPGLARLARYARLSEDHTKRTVRALVRAGHIKREVNSAPDSRIPLNRRPNCYEIVGNVASGRGRWSPPDESSRGAKPAPRPHGGGDHLSPPVGGDEPCPPTPLGGDNHAPLGGDNHAPLGGIIRPPKPSEEPNDGTSTEVEVLLCSPAGERAGGTPAAGGASVTSLPLPGLPADDRDGVAAKVRGAAAAARAEAFETWWASYPRKVGKQAAAKWWEKHKPDPVLVAQATGHYLEARALYERTYPGAVPPDWKHGSSFLIGSGPGHSWLDFVDGPTIEGWPRPKDVGGKAEKISRLRQQINGLGDISGVAGGATVVDVEVATERRTG